MKQKCWIVVLLRVSNALILDTSRIHLTFCLAFSHFFQTILYENSIVRNHFCKARKSYNSFLTWLVERLSGRPHSFVLHTEDYFFSVLRIDKEGIRDAYSGLLFLRMQRQLNNNI